MLYQVVVLCVAVLAPSADPVKLSPQFEADDEDELKEKVGAWLDSTGYRLVEGTEPEVTTLEVDGLTPAPTTRGAEVDELLGEASATIADLRSQVGDLEGKLVDRADQVSDFAGKLEVATKALAERDAKIAEFEAREQAQRTAVVNDKPADGETPAP